MEIIETKEAFTIVGEETFDSYDKRSWSRKQVEALISNPDAYQLRFYARKLADNERNVHRGKAQLDAALASKITQLRSESRG